ncbi:hypothetical protein DITRI_Ditri19aG0189100 [Diplodiscus trichospermus]
MKLLDGSEKVDCIHCKSNLSILANKSTSHLSRYLKGCFKPHIFQKQQNKITLLEVNSEKDEQFVTLALIDGKFDMAKMREVVANWILMQEIIKEEGFNMMQRREIPK